MTAIEWLAWGSLLGMLAFMLDPPRPCRRAGIESARRLAKWRRAKRCC